MTPQTTAGTKMKRVLTVVLALAIGIAIVATFISRKQPPERVEAVESARSVRVMEAALVPFIMQASGFGSATPDKTWSAVSNVKGHVIDRHETLESGAVVLKGELLLEIDPGFYELALAEANAEIASVDAEVAQLAQEAINTEALLELERQRLELAEADLERTRGLVASNTLAQTQLDTQLRTTLQQRQAVQALINQQNIIPIQLERLGTQQERAISKRAQVQSDLEDTKIYAPFDLRINEVSAEMHQYINPGQILLTGDGTKAVEVILNVAMPGLRRLVAELPTENGAPDIGALSAYVQLVNQNQAWDAQVVRIANGIDPATRSVRVVLSIPQPQGPLHPINNPPLPKGLYVEGILSTAATQQQMVIPQQAIHEGWVYLVNADNRLRRTEIEVAFQQNGLAIISAGLEPGDIVILDDIVPAISGSLLDPQRDLATETALISMATGEAK